MKICEGNTIWCDLCSFVLVICKIL